MSGAQGSVGEGDNTGGVAEESFAGIPAAIIGTSKAGPAFVPRILNSEDAFVDTFGDITGDKWGTVAVRAWYSEAQENAGLVYLRVLGVGNGRAKTTNNVVTNAGFVVGEKQVHDEIDKANADREGFGTVTVGSVSANPYANQPTQVSAAVAATAEITFTGDATPNQTIVIISSDGTSRTYSAKSSGNAAAGTYDCNNGVATSATTLAAAINNNDSTGHASKITATVPSTGVVLLTQDVAGVAGNTTITSGLSNATVPATFTGGRAEVQSTAKPGRMYFLSTIMSQSAGSTYLSDAGLTGKSDSILRAVIMVASGVQLQLSGWNSGNPHGGGASTDYDVTGSAYAYDDSTGAKDLGNWVGSMDNAQSVNLIFNGMKLGPAAPADGRVLSVGLNPDISSYLGDLNTDPTLFEEKGHYLYAHYPVPGDMALPLTASNVHSYTQGSKTYYHNVLLTTGSSGRNTYDAGAYKPNYEGWATRFKTPFTPWVISQAVGGTEQKLFRLHALDDGQGPEDQFFAEIKNIVYPSVAGEYASFDVLIRSYGNQRFSGGGLTGNTVTQPNPTDNTIHPTAASGDLSFSNVNLDPNSTDYIARRIGDFHRYYDFDAAVNEQKLVLKGLYENTNKFVRIEVSDNVAAGKVPKDTVPFGFQGPHHLVTSGSNDGLAPIQTGQVGGGDKSGEDILPSRFGEYAGSAWVHNAGMGMIQPPIPMRIKTVNGQTGVPLPWGVRFDKPTDGFLYTSGATSDPISLTGTTITTTSDQKVNNSELLWTAEGDLIRQINKFFPSYSSYPSWVGDNAGTANTSNGGVLDANEFNINKFSLGKVYVRTFTNANSEVKPDTARWHQARYIRNGVDPSTSGFRFLKPSDLKSTDGNVNYTRFILPFQGGFDGLNIFNRNKADMNHWAAHYEQEDSDNQGGLLGPTVAAYRKAIDIIAEKADIDINALAIPDQRSSFVTDYAAEKMEERFDAIYIMDIENCSQFGASAGNVLFHGNPSQTYLGSGASVNTFYSIERFAARGLSNSFAAAYYPNVQLAITPPGNPNADPETYDAVPASIAGLMAFARTERVEGPWGTPAGAKNGAPAAVIDTQVEIEPKDNNDLYANSINPILIFKNNASIPELRSGQDLEVAGVGVINGQKTLLNKTSALNRLDVRKLMVYIRRKVRDFALSILFEPNQPDVLGNLSKQVSRMLDDLVAVEAVKQYRVVIDDTTTSQADIENNTVRGKVFVQPYRSTEIIAIDVSLENGSGA